jgi:AraC family transcriptional regulator
LGGNAVIVASIVGLACGSFVKIGAQAIFNMMQPKIEFLTEKKLVGKHATMSLAQNETANLWRSFMPRRMEIANRLKNELISMQIYPAGFDFTFADLHQPFEKWAAVEVPDFEAVPAGMEPFVLLSGLYAVFHYQGLNTDTRIFQYIFGAWLPNSEYAIDSRPHFEILGEKYKNNDPNSEEEIWIPIQKK